MPNSGTSSEIVERGSSSNHPDSDGEVLVQKSGEVSLSSCKYKSSPYYTRQLSLHSQIISFRKLLGKFGEWACWSVEQRRVYSIYYKVL